MARIFISYRHDDSAANAGRIYDRLCSNFGEPNVFIDVNNVDLGDDFVGRIQRSLASCDVLLAIIGKQWLGAKDHAGLLRLSDPNDYVAVEIATGLETIGILVVPILVDGALMPLASELPVRLHALPKRHALEISNREFHQALAKLISRIEQHMQNPSFPGDQQQKVSSGGIGGQHRDRQAEGFSRLSPRRTLPEELYLLCADDDGHFTHALTEYDGLAVAVLAELVLQGRLSFEHAKSQRYRGGIVTVSMRDRTLTGDAILDHALEDLIRCGSYLGKPNWISYFGGAYYYNAIQEKLEQEGVLTRRVRTHWFSSDSVYYSLASATAQNQTRLLFSQGVEGGEITDRVAALVSISLTSKHAPSGISARLWQMARFVAENNDLGCALSEIIRQKRIRAEDEGASNSSNVS